MFQGWYADAEYTIEFDFEQPILANTDIYAKWRQEGDFSAFEERFVAHYSPFAFDGGVYAGMENPELSFTCKSILFSSSIHPNQLQFSGILSGLKATSVTVDKSNIKVNTKGWLRQGTGYVTFAKELTSYEEYFTTRVEVKESLPYLNPLSFSYEVVEGQGIIKANLQSGIDNVKNPDNLSSGDYCAKLQSGEYPYLSLENAHGTTMEVFGVSEDFSAIGVKFILTAEFNDGVFERLKGLRLAYTADLFESGRAYGVPLDFSDHYTITELSLAQSDATHHEGTAKIRLANTLITQEFKDNKDELLKDPFNQNSLLKIPDANVILKKIDLPDDTHVNVNFTVEAESLNSDTAVIDFNPIQLSEEKIVHLTKMGWNDNPIVPELENAPIQIITTTEKTGTLSQTAASSYAGIRSAVQGEAGISRAGEDPELDAFISGATALAKIGFGIYSGNFAMAKETVGNYFGIDSLLSPTTRILNSLQSIFEELKVIEAKIDSISEQLATVQAELENLGRSAVLNNFLTAHSAWTDFITDYYTPLTDQITSYTNNYFRYFYDFVKQSVKNEGNEGVSVTLHYDDQGVLAYPDEYGTDSVDGRLIDVSATKVIEMPELISALTGIRENGGHSYMEIEDDVIADIANSRHYDDALISDIINTIRFNAISSYFEEDNVKDDFINVFTNFRRALTGTQLQVAINPLDAYALMLQSIYNFGFETEPEMNLALIKLTATYHTANVIAGYVDLIDDGSIITSGSDSELTKKVQEELSSERFFHRNDGNGNPYNFVTGSYTSVKCNTYSLMWWDWGSDCVNRMYLNNTTEWNYPTIDHISSISEADIRFMELKVRVMNKIKNTNYTFREYFAHIGVIPTNIMNQVLGVIMSIDCMLDDEDDIEELSYPCWLTHQGQEAWSGHGHYTDPIKDYADPHDLDGDWTYAIKGWMYYFDDGKCYNAILAVDAYKEFYMNVTNPAGWVNGTNYFGSGRGPWDCPEAVEYGTCIYAYYVNIAPV